MTKRKIILPVVLLLLASSGCKEAKQIDGSEFAEKWTISDKHSAISWWYLGEDENQYFIAEKWPTKNSIYSISKGVIIVNDIEAFAYDSGKEPVNLKNHNVKFK